MDDMLRQCDFEQAAKLLLRPDALALVSPHVALLQASALQTLGLSSDGACQGPVLWARLAADDAYADVDGRERVLTLMHEVAAACEWANAKLGVGVGQKAQLLLDLSQADDQALGACAFLLWQKVARPRLYAMLWQMLGRIQVASHPPPSPLPLDHYPAAIERILVVVPARAAGAQSKDNMQIGLTIAPVWRFVESLTRNIPLADSLAGSVLLDSETRSMIQVTPSTTAKAALDNLAQQARDGAAQASNTITLPVPSPSTWTPRLVQSQRSSELASEVFEEEVFDDEYEPIVSMVQGSGSLLMQPRASSRLSNPPSKALSKKPPAPPQQGSMLVQPSAPSSINDNTSRQNSRGDMKWPRPMPADQPQPFKPPAPPQTGSMLVQPGAPESFKDNMSRRASRGDMKWPRPKPGDQAPGQSEEES